MVVSIIDARRRNTYASAGIVIPTAARHNFRKFLRDIEEKLLEVGVYPSFFIVKAGAFEARFLSGHKGSAERMAFIEGAVPIGERIIAGMNSASKGNDLLVVTCDDFDHLACSIPRFAQTLLKDNEFQVGAWNPSSYMYLPWLLFVNEAATSVAVTYANPKHPAELLPPKALNLESAKRFAQESQATWHQAYIGLYGVVSVKMGELLDSFDELFKGNPEAKNVGLEAGLVLAAHHIGLKTGQLEVPKRFEHPLYDRKSPTYRDDVEKYRNGRLAQFLSGIALVESYVAQYAPEKQGAILQLKEEAIKTLKTADFYWPAPHCGWPVRSDWNMPIVTAF